MAHHDYLSLEGGHQMVEFMVKQCAINTEDKVYLLLQLLFCCLLLLIVVIVVVVCCCEGKGR